MLPWCSVHLNERQRERRIWGAHAPSRPGDDALVIADFSSQARRYYCAVQSSFRRGAETQHARARVLSEHHSRCYHASDMGH